MYTREICSIYNQVWSHQDDPQDLSILTYKKSVEGFNNDVKSLVIFNSSATPNKGFVLKQKNMYKFLKIYITAIPCKTPTTGIIKCSNWYVKVNGQSKHDSLQFTTV